MLAPGRGLVVADNQDHGLVGGKWLLDYTHKQHLVDSLNWRRFHSSRDSSFPQEPALDLRITMAIQSIHHTIKPIGRQMRHSIDTDATA